MLTSFLLILFFSHNVAALGYVCSGLHNISTFRQICTITLQFILLAVFAKASITIITAYTKGILLK